MTSLTAHVTDILVHTANILAGIW